MISFLFRKVVTDEIYTAFGRTGKMFASEHFVIPDIIVVGKGFGGEILPYSGIIGKEELNIIDFKSIGHYTREKSTMCASVARATIDFVVEEGLVPKTEELGNYFRAGLEALQKNFSIIGNISGLGLNLAVDLVKDQVTKERAKTEAEELLKNCMEHGISFKLIQGNILNLKPSLIVTKKEVDHVLETLEKGFSLLQSKII